MMEFMRIIENPRKCMQRVGFLKWLIYSCSRSATSNLKNLGTNLIEVISRKVVVPITPEITLYIKSALTSPAHREVFNNVKKLEKAGKLENISIELQDAYLSSSNIPSRRGRLAKDEWFEYPSFAIGLSLIKKGTYSLSVRGLSFLSLVPQDEIYSFKEFKPSSNPLLCSKEQNLLLLYCLIENDGQTLRHLYTKLINKSDTFSDIEAAEYLSEVFEQILKESKARVRSGDDLRRIQRIEKTIERLEKVKGKPSTGGGGVRHETIALRLEPLVDFGLLSKPDPFAYRYQITEATRKFFEPLINAESIEHFLQHSFFDTAKRALNLTGEHRTDREIILPAIQKAYTDLKSPLGYAPILEVSLLAGIHSITESNAYFELSESLDTLKSLQKEKPELVRFNVDRWGVLTFVKFNNNIMKAAGE
jgi:hypothetical protein